MISIFRSIGALIFILWMFCTAAYAETYVYIEESMRMGRLVYGVNGCGPGSSRGWVEDDDLGLSRHIGLSGVKRYIQTGTPDKADRARPRILRSREDASGNPCDERESNVLMPGGRLNRFESVVSGDKLIAILKAIFDQNTEPDQYVVLRPSNDKPDIRFTNNPKRLVFAVTLNGHGDEREVITFLNEANRWLKNIWLKKIDMASGNGGHVLLVFMSSASDDISVVRQGWHRYPFAYLDNAPQNIKKAVIKNDSVMYELLSELPDADVAPKPIAMFVFPDIESIRHYQPIVAPPNLTITYGTNLITFNDLYTNEPILSARDPIQSLRAALLPPVFGATKAYKYSEESVLPVNMKFNLQEDGDNDDFLLGNILSNNRNLVFNIKRGKLHYHVPDRSNAMSDWLHFGSSWLLVIIFLYLLYCNFILFYPMLRKRALSAGALSLILFCAMFIGYVVIINELWLRARDEMTLMIINIVLFLFFAGLIIYIVHPCKWIGHRAINMIKRDLKKIKESPKEIIDYAEITFS